MKEYNDSLYKKSRVIQNTNKSTHNEKLEFAQKEHIESCSCTGCLSQKIRNNSTVQRLCNAGHEEHPTGKCPHPNLKVVFTSGHTKIGDGGKVETTKRRHGKPGKTRTRSSSDVLTRAKAAYEADQLTYVRTDDNDIIYSMPRKKTDSTKDPRHFAVHRGGGGGDGLLEIFEVPNSTVGRTLIFDEFSDSESDD